MDTLFEDRLDAGRQLAEPLLRFADENPLVLGLARGGVILAAAIAEALGAELDVLVVRKIGAPGNPEYGVGAVAPLDVCVFDADAMQALRLTPELLHSTVNRELEEIERRLTTYRQGRPPLDVANRLVILVDDGLATGITAMAAARYIKRLGARYVVFAAPVCSRPGRAVLEREVEEVVCIKTPMMFYAVGMWFEDFSQVEDQQVIAALAAAHSKESFV